MPEFSKEDREGGKKERENKENIEGKRKRGREEGKRGKQESSGKRVGGD